MKQLRKSFIIVLALIMVLGNTLSVSASNIEDVLLPYEDRLSEINEELGTNYKLATEDELNAMDTSMDKLIDFFTSMDLEEFEDYIMELHNNSVIEENTDCREENGIMPLADDSKQFYFYDKVHWFYLDTKTVTVNNVVYYNISSDSPALYRANTDGSDKTLIMEKSIASISCTSIYTFFQIADDETLYRIETNGKPNVQVFYIQPQ